MIQSSQKFEYFRNKVVKTRCGIVVWILTISSIFIFDVEESIYGIPTKQLCLGDIENLDQLLFINSFIRSLFVQLIHSLILGPIIIIHLFIWTLVGQSSVNSLRYFWSFFNFFLCFCSLMCLCFLFRHPFINFVCSMFIVWWLNER